MEHLAKGRKLTQADMLTYVLLTDVGNYADICTADRRRQIC